MSGSASHRDDCNKRKSAIAPEKEVSSWTCGNVREGLKRISEMRVHTNGHSITERKKE